MINCYWFTRKLLFTLDAMWPRFTSYCWTYYYNRGICRKIVNISFLNFYEQKEASLGQKPIDEPAKTRRKGQRQGIHCHHWMPCLRDYCSIFLRKCLLRKAMISFGYSFISDDSHIVTRLSALFPGALYFCDFFKFLLQIPIDPFINTMQPLITLVSF